MTMNVTTMPAKDLAYTNCAYCSPTDLRNFLVPGSKFADAFVLTLAYPFITLLIPNLQIHSVSVFIIVELYPMNADERMEFVLSIIIIIFNDIALTVKHCPRRHS